MEWNKENQVEPLPTIQTDMANEIHLLLNEARVGENRIFQEQRRFGEQLKL